MTGGARPDPLVGVLGGLVRDGTLTDAQALRVDQALRAAGVVRTDERPGGVTAAEVLTYLGTALTIGALVLVVGLSWDELGRTGRIAVCGAITVLLLAVAVVVSVWSSSLFRHRRYTVASVLAALAAVGAAITAGLVADLALPGGGPWPTLIVGVVVVLVGACAYLAWRGAPSVLVTFAGGLGVVGGVLALALPDAAEAGDTADTVYALAYMGYGALWVAGGRLLRNPHPAGVLGGLVALGTAEYLAVTEAWLGLVLGLVVVAGTFGLFWFTRRWWYAALGVLGALVVPSTAVGTLWSGAFAAVVLLVVGVLLVVAALVLARTRRRRGASA